MAVQHDAAPVGTALDPLPSARSTMARPKQVTSTATFSLDGVVVHDISVTKEKTSLTFTVQTDAGAMKLAMNAPWGPHPKLKGVLDEMAAVASELCEVSQTKGNPVTVKKVAFKRNTERSLGAVITAHREYTKSLGGLTMNTPLKYIEDEAGELTLSDSQGSVLQRVYDECVVFLGRPTPQLDAFTPGPPSEDGFDDGGEELAKVKAKRDGKEK